MAIKRDFTVNDAVRERVPLLIGLTGPSGTGKTFSALRLATGIQSVVGGEIYYIDTEAKRSLHYADKFKFKHVPFGAPFGSLDYLEALKFCVAQGAKTIIVDSMSHEHEGAGGMIDLQAQIVQRMSGGDWKKAERVKMLAWSEPKQKRRELLNGILQLNANFIFCFRAKSTSKPGKDEQGKSVVIPMGYMPIAGEEFVFEMTLNCLLLPGARGLPTWNPENIGEKAMVKLPDQFEAMRTMTRPLDEALGRRLAEWASGGAPEQTNSHPSTAECSPARNDGEALQTSAGVEAADAQEGRSDEQHGDQHDGTEGNRWDADVADWTERLSRASIVGDILSVRADFDKQRDFLPDDVVASVEVCIDAARSRLGVK